MNSEKAAITAVICTRNRGDRIVATVNSILANTHPNFELLIVDQSTNDVTKEALQLFLQLPHVRYIRSNTVGAGHSRQIGLLQAKGDIVAFTDDDCTVPPEWLTTLATIFESEPSVGVVYGNVLAAPHDESKGTVPHHVNTTSRTISSLTKYWKSIGMGANMALRRQPCLAIGGVDRSLGPGSRFCSGEDHDMAIRMLVNGLAVHETAKTFVVHDGFRSLADFRELTRRDWYAIGAVHAKYFKCKYLAVIPLILFNTVVRGFWHPISMIGQGKRPQGFKRLLFYGEGFSAGMRSKVNCEKHLYWIDEIVLQESLSQG
jgi:glycosyltransferase involved in cell wall biosynthesis